MVRNLKSEEQAQDVQERFNCQPCEKRGQQTVIVSTIFPCVWERVDILSVMWYLETETKGEETPAGM